MVNDTDDHAYKLQAVHPGRNELIHSFLPLLLILENNRFGVFRLEPLAIKRINKPVREFCSARASVSPLQPMIRWERNEAKDLLS